MLNIIPKESIMGENEGMKKILYEFRTDTKIDDRLISKIYNTK